MIVRISGEGQYRLDDHHREALNELDDSAVAAVEADDEERFRSTFEGMLDFVRNAGAALEADELVGSDLILPPADLSLAEAKTEFSGEGLIPD